MSFNIDKYIQSEIIEDYCLGLLSEEESNKLMLLSEKYPQLKQAIKSTQSSLDAYVNEYSIEPPVGLRGSIFKTFDKLATLDFPDISQFIDLTYQPYKVSEWQQAISDFKQPDFQNQHLETLYDDEDKVMFVGWLKNGLEPEIHTDLLEKFLVLEGSCICHLDDRVVTLEAGDKLEIPLHVVHSLVVTSEIPLKVILTREKLVS